MGTQTQASTIGLWREMFLTRPNLGFNDYRIEWAGIQNDAEGTDQTAKSAGLVSKYLRMFKAEAATEQVVSEPFSDPMETLIDMQSQLAGLAREAEGVTNQCRFLADVVVKAIGMLTDSQIIDGLTSQTARMQQEIDSLKHHLDASNERLQQERLDRNVPIHGEATR